jgi:DNA invertase Pin-like site-specific DNA recombinase
VKRLPRSLDEIGGLRAARWIRESTAGQYDRYGPASQREQQDRFIERHGLVDSGLVYQVAHSGRTVWRSAMMATMLDDLRSGRFDLLLTGYSDRWQRNLRRTLELLEDDLHPNGVALVMCDRKILSSDPSDWDELISEAAGAEKYSRRLSERITEGYAAKFDQERDPGGHAGLGFRRLPQPPHTLEIDPEAMAIVVGLFERYALGNVSATQLEDETGLAATRIRMILMNPCTTAGSDVTAARTRRAARRRGGRRHPSRTSCGPGWRRSGEPRPAAVDRRTGIVLTCSAASSSASVVDVSATTARSPMAVTASSTPSRVRRGVARLASAMRRGRALCSPRSPASRSMT